MLTEAVSNGDRNQPSGPILLKVMKLSNQPQNIVDFYELLNKAEEEARSIRNNANINRYLQTIEELHHCFVVHHLWNTKWDTFATYIEGKGVLNTLDALAYFFNFQNPAIFLEQDFLDKLKSEFSSLLERIFESDLSKELKRFLIERIEDILKAIRRYYIDGTEGLEKATKSLVSDLVMAEHSLKDNDKNNPLYKRVKAWGLSLLIYIAPSPYDIIGAVPDIHDFWVPKFEELAAGQQKVEQIICETSTIQEAFEKTSYIFNKQQQKMIAGREPKALPASKEDSEVTKDDKSDP
ncbi:hypothetical protein H6G41_09650 [Tolypothrix sp. FACHB-123]|uniref:hypothetical protein n=1 Tax=Tolypothrix sp. FACHB-123 TaxID=2692868 RepID=UPI00168347DC|nr:hypothetical protein [Tolypothrix sp. FACHB-123]MBD2354883.1 hypothetical protein [Tolypothrix sp. FACHB-123]